MTSTRGTPHLNPLPGNGERRIRRSAGSFSRPDTFASEEVAIRLSLSQRERIEVRDRARCAFRAPTKLLAERCPVLRELDDSKIAALRFLGTRVTRLGHGRVRDRSGNCVRLRRVPRQALLKGNRSRVRKNRTDAGAGICSRQSFDSADGAKERVPIWLRAYGDYKRGSQDYLTSSRSVREGRSAPHLNPLPATGRGGLNKRVASGQRLARSESQQGFRLSILKGRR